MTGYDVEIVRAADGETRVHHIEHPYGQSEWFGWADGNDSCDCNRMLYFERAAGQQIAPDDERVQCGEHRYFVTAFILPNGERLDGPDKGKESIEP